MKKTAFVIATVMAAVCALLLATPSATMAQSIAHIGSYDSLGFVSGVMAQGEYAYIADNILGLVILDISDPTTPFVTGRYAPPLRIYDMDIYGDTVYLAAGESEPYMGAMYIVDVSDKYYPFLMSALTFQWEATAIAVSINPYNDQEFAYLANYGGNKIISVSNPYAPVEVGQFTVPGYPADMMCNDPYLYAAAYNEGLQILSIYNPSNPAPAGGCDTPGSAVGVAQRRNQTPYTFIADADSGLQVIDSYDPTNPTRVGHLQTIDRLTDIAAGDYFIFAALEDSGIAVVRAGDPENPRIYASTPVPYRIAGISLGDGVIVVAGGESMDIYQLDPVGCDYVPGDINGNGNMNGIDIVYCVSYLKGGSAPPIGCDCPPIPYPFYAAGDVNGSCVFNGIDLTFYVAWAKGLQPELFFCPGCPPND